MEKKLTINDIAELSGVAKSTVSRYLNGGSVRGSTAQKIRRVIEENHYEPNVFARLSAKNSRIIGLIVPGFNSVTTPRLVEVIVAYLKEQDFTPLIMHTGNDLEEEVRSIDRLKNMNVDGIMVLATAVTDRHKDVVEKSAIPILFLGQKCAGGNFVITDDYQAGFELGKYLGEQGAEKVVQLWVGQDDSAVGGDRRQGVEDGLKSCGVSSIRFAETSFFYGDAVKNTERLLEQYGVPDTIICATDRIAEGVYKVLRERGIRIPEDVSVTGFGDYETSELLTPPLTTVKMDLKSWGEVGAETMLQMIQGKPVSSQQTIPCQLIKRESVKNRK